MNIPVTELLRIILGRRKSWRLGRSLYMRAREDSSNLAKINGEEKLQQELIKRISNTQDKIIVFDIGANIGDWTWSLLQYAYELNLECLLEIHCFEPIPSAFEVLENRINKHPLGKYVHLNPQALSDKDGITEMYIFGETSGRNSLFPDAMNREIRSIKVNTTKIETYCENKKIQYIHYLKCDTEGADFDVIQGAKGLFNEKRIMAFQFEYNHRWIYSRHYLKDVYDVFQNTQYHIGKVIPDGIEIYKEWHPELERFFEGNYVLLQTEALRWFTTFYGEFDEDNTFRIQTESIPNRVRKHFDLIENY